MNLYFEKHNKIQMRSEELFAKNEEYSNLLSTCFVPESKELEKWMKEPYEKNPLYPEQLIHKTATGERVRSKSEEIIAMLLLAHGIPFRYECALYIGGKTYYPDFTIRHPNTGEVYYWEHFGLIDDSQYCNSAMSKMKKYISNGIIPTIHLITTYETQEYPLDSARVEEIIQMYFG